MTGRIGSLFSGSGMLDEAVRSMLGGGVAWHAEHEPATEKNPRSSQAAARLLAYRYPGVPNLGDITAVDWSQVEPVDVLTGGSPCQDVSHAGKRAGMHEGTRSNLWVAMREAVATLRPSLVIWENVRGAYSACADSEMGSCPRCVGDDPTGRHAPNLRALGRVLGDLSALGYDTRWCGLRAADVGAPHGRFRVFVAATDTQRVGRDGRSPDPWREAVGRTAATGPGGRVAADATNVGHERRGPARGRRDGPPNGSCDDCHHDWWRHTRERGCTARPLTHGGQYECWCDRRPSVRQQLCSRQRVHGAHEWISRDSGPVWCPGIAADAASDGRPRVDDSGSSEAARDGRQRDAAGSPRPRAAADADRDTLRQQPVAGTERGSETEPGQLVQWGPYEPAIRRWERILGRPAPAPTELGPRGGQRLSPKLTEWMMGWPEGWVTDVPGISRNDALRICGNGVVPQQAAAALRWLLSINASAVAASVVRRTVTYGEWEPVSD